MCEDKICLICGEKLSSFDTGGSPLMLLSYECAKCGKFNVTHQLDRHVQYSKKIIFQAPCEDLALIRHVLAQYQMNGIEPTVDEPFVNKILQNKSLPDLEGMIENLLHFLGKSRKYGHYISVRAERIQSIAGALDREALRFLLDTLVEEEKLIRDSRVGSTLKHGGEGLLGLTPAGWVKHDELREKGSKKAFMAMKFNKDNVRKFYEEYLIKAVRETGFELFTVDDQPKAGNINNRILVDIRNSRFLVADLTYGNQGVYYEAGFARGLRKDVFFTCHTKWFEKRHFDVSPSYTAKWGDTEDVCRKAAEELKAAIRETLFGEAKGTDTESRTDNCW